MSDHPLAMSGVGNQTRYFIEALLKTGRFSFVCFGGAMRHENYTPQKVDPYGEDWIIYPVDGYGDADKIRSVISSHKPDILWFMTDPRFYEWLWDIENEVRPNIPMVYYHVWDNYPYPIFNKNFYDSTDIVATISKVTDDIVRTVSPEVETHYIPHAVDTSVFKPMPDSIVSNIRKQQFGESAEELFVLFWNNRNARRKMSGSLVWWFNEWAEKIGVEKVKLILHTDPKDPHGQDLDAILQEVGAIDGRILISRAKVDPTSLATMYNICDATINISDAEGFGLATLESLACGTPIIVNMTGGLQEQVTDGQDWFGIGIQPASKAIIGSQQVPYIYEDRISKEDFHAALTALYEKTKKERAEMGLKGRKHVEKNYNFDTFNKSWVDLMDSIHNRYGSWETRRGYRSWEMVEIK